MSNDIEVRPMTPGDAPGVSECIVRCYGDTYPKRVMYRPEEVAMLVRSGAYNGVVAASGAEVVAHIGFTWPTRASTVVEAGTTVVDPGFRGQGLMGRLGVALAEALAAEGAVGFIHFPTTAHPVMQRASLSAGGRETGLMLAYLPAEARDTAMGAVGEERLAVTVVFQPVLKAPSQDIYLPRRYDGLIRGFADGLGLSRSAAGPFRMPSGESQLESGFDASRGLLRISADRIGADLATTVARVAATHAAGLVHVDLPMDDPAIDHAVEELRRSSYAFAAWLPGWAAHDVLRLQHVASPSDGELSPSLFSPEARALLAVIRTELLRPD
jgi:GNAT superfamily N-acetyltransferase